MNNYGDLPEYPPPSVTLAEKLEAPKIVLRKKIIEIGIQSYPIAATGWSLISKSRNLIIITDESLVMINKKVTFWKLLFRIQICSFTRQNKVWKW